MYLDGQNVSFCCSLDFSLFSGSFQASRENFLEGQVNCEGYDKPILVQGREGLNRAIDGDTVAVR